jgi:hypothetical protein
MELEPSFEYDITLTNPKKFELDLKSLIERMPFILEIYNSAYVNYNMAPSNQEYENALLNVKNNIITTNGSLFVLSNDIDSNTKLITNKLRILDEKIQQEKILNKTLKVKSESDTDKINASSQMIDEYKEIYNLKYLNNFNIFIGIIIGYVAMTKIFK